MTARRAVDQPQATASGEKTSTAHVISFALEYDGQSIPSDVRAIASLLVADCVGVMLAGMTSEVGRKITAYARQFEGGPAGRIIGEVEATTVSAAALANGTLAHALDLDDDEPILLIGHPSAPVLSALLAVANEAKCSGRAFLDAFIVGVESEVRIAAALNPHHFNAGWHTTSTMGVLGAVVACSRLLSLDRSAATNALGIAASMTSGLRVNFGTMTKPLHVGRAAEAAVVASALAADGFTGARNVLDGPLGVGTVYGAGDAAVRASVRRLGRDWALLDPGVAIKRFPSCSNTHPAIDAVLKLRDRGVFDALPQKVICNVAPGTERILIHDDPATPLQAKFSLPYCLAAAVVRGTLWLDDFTAESIADPAVRRMMSRIETRLDPSLVRSEFGVSTSARVEVTQADGEHVGITCDVPRGSPSDPLSRDELANKFAACAHHAGIKADGVFDRLLAIDHELNIWDIVGVLALDSAALG